MYFGQSDKRRLGSLERPLNVAAAPPRRRRPSEERLNVFLCLMRGAISLMATEARQIPICDGGMNERGPILNFAE